MESLAYVKLFSHVFASWVFLALIFKRSKDKLMPVTLVQFALCKQELGCGLEMDVAAFQITAIQLVIRGEETIKIIHLPNSPVPCFERKSIFVTAKTLPKGN